MINSILTKKLDYIKVLISRSLTNSHTGHYYIPLIDVSRKYDYMKEEIDNFETS